MIFIISGQKNRDVCRYVEFASHALLKKTIHFVFFRMLQVFAFSSGNDSGRPPPFGRVGCHSLCGYCRRY